MPAFKYTFMLFSCAFGQLANTTWPVEGGNQRQTHTAFVTGPQLGQLAWSRVIGPPPSYSPGPVVGPDGAVVALSGSGGLYSLDPRTGDVRWSTALDAGITYYSAAVGADNTIFVGSMSLVRALYAINGTTGAVKWNFSLPGGYPNGYPLVSKDGIVFTYDASGASRRLYAINGSTGALLWSNTALQPVGRPAFGVDGTMYAPCYSVANAKYYVSSFNCTMGVTKWSFETPWGISVYPTVGLDDIVYFSTTGSWFTGNYSGTNTTYAIKNGTLVWTYYSPIAFPVQLLLGQDGTVFLLMIYIGNPVSRYGMFALDGKSGALQWNVTMTLTGNGNYPSSATMGADGTVYVVFNYLHIVAINSRNGAVKWRIPFPLRSDGYDEMYGSEPALGPDGSLYLTMAGHTVYAFKDSPSPTSTGSVTTSATASTSATSSATSSTSASSSTPATPSGTSSASSTASWSPTRTPPICRPPANNVIILTGTAGTYLPVSMLSAGNNGMYTSGSCEAAFKTFYTGSRLVFSLFLGDSTRLGGTLTVTTCGQTRNNTVLYVGTGCPTWAMPFGCLVGNDDAATTCSSNPLASRISLTATQRTYFIQVGGVNGLPITAGLQWVYAAPSATPSGTHTRTRTQSRAAVGTRTKSVSATPSTTPGRSKSATQTRTRKAK